MNIDFDFPVYVRGVREGQKRKTRNFGTVPVRVELAECSTSEITEVGRIRFDTWKTAPFHRYYIHNDQLYESVGFLHDLGRTFSPYMKSDNNPFFSGQERFLRHQLQDMDGRKGINIYERDRRRTSDPKPLKSLEKLRYASFEEAAVEHQIATFSERCGKMLVSDGELFMKTKQPYLSVELMHENNDVWYSVQPRQRGEHGIRVGRKGDPNPGHAAFHMADDEELQTFLENAGVPFDQMDLDHHDNVLILDRTAFSGDSRQLSIYSAAARYLRLAPTNPAVQIPEEIEDMYDIVNHGSDDDYDPVLGFLFQRAVELHDVGAEVFTDRNEYLSAQCVINMWGDHELGLQFSEPKIPSI